MKRLMDPKFALLIAPLPAEDCKELFLAILEYPDRPCDLALWPYIKSHLDEDEEKYQQKCKRLAENKLISAEVRLKSGALGKEESLQNNKTEHNNTMRDRADGLLKNFSNSFSPNRAFKVIIDSEFSLVEIIRRNPSLAEHFSKYSSDHLATAQESLKRKCFGQTKTISQLLGWINNEGRFA